ncbi:MAG: type II toxin-antitoxin system RnlA family toxin [Nitrospirae bacterium]|uniref:RNase LS family HEPN domain-containing protein n=1 Tax=Candidatus Magnetobacterium casense TaxID=1455061 RepID=UPI00058CA3BD|nr:RNase LS family HEPN domain-containing protein [Candidatus Magnetobacterium casensis]MBF0337919.1 type II toxin-antitoxin system RnlA family toxin [Nitrospirota bacterium]
MDDKYKNLNITLEEVIDLINNYIRSLNGVLSCNERPNNLTQLSIEIPGQKTALINVYITKKGISINPDAGKNNILSSDIANIIVESSEKVKNESKSFESIHENLWGEFLEYLREANINHETKDDNIRTVLKLSYDNVTLAVTWYKTTHKVLIQGMSTLLWNSVIYWFTSKTTDNPTSFINNLFVGNYKIPQQTIAYPDYKSLDDELMVQLGDIYYKNHKGYEAIKSFEKELLRTSLLLIKINIELPTYSYVIYPCFLVIEGILKRICIRNFGLNSFIPKTGGFAQFEDAPDIKLKSSHAIQISQESTIKYIEKLYIFFKTKRNRYFHNNGVSIPLVTNKSDAIELYEEVIDLIREYAAHLNVLS